MIDSLCGIRLPVAGKTEAREAFGQVAREDATLFVGTKVQPNSRAYEWNLVAAVENFSDHGDPCAFYFKLDNYAKSPSFGGVVEVRQAGTSSAASPMWGVEVDMMTQPDVHMGGRTAVGVVVGAQNMALGPGYVDQAFNVIPWAWDAKQGFVGYAYRCQMPVRHSAFSMLSGQSIEFDGQAGYNAPPGEVTQRFDPATGYMQFCLRGVPTFEIQMETGEIRIKGKTVAL